MAPHPGIDTAQIKEKAQKDLLDLLEGVCKASRIYKLSGGWINVKLGSRKEEPCNTEIACWPHQ